MRSRQLNPLIWTLAIGFVGALGLASADQSLQKNKNRVDICRFKRSQSRWRLISVPAKDAIRHLGRHNDALPGRRSLRTGELLDRKCQVVVECPCVGLKHNGIVWDDTFNTTLRFGRDELNGRVIELFQIDSPPGSDGALTTQVPDDPFVSSCLVQLNDLTPLGGIEFPIVLEINPEEVEACNDSLRQIAANDGVHCPE